MKGDTAMKILVTCEIRRSSMEPQKGGAWDKDSEHLSQDVVNTIIHALYKNNYSCTLVETHDELLNIAHEKKNQYIFCVNLSVGHGGPSTKVFTASLLDILRIPYFGSPPHALAITRNKAVMKSVARTLGIPTPNWSQLDPYENIPSDINIKLPAIVKPIHESSSIGIDNRSLVESISQMRNSAKRIWECYQQPALVEEFIPGFDLEVPLRGFPILKPIGCVAIVPEINSTGSSILTSNMVHQDAYHFTMPNEVVRKWTKERETILKEWSQKLAKSVGIRDYGRMDFRVTPEGELWFIETSTHPYLAEHSSFAWLATRAGISYDEMWSQLLTTVRSRCEFKIRSQNEELANIGRQPAFSGITPLTQAYIKQSEIDCTEHMSQMTREQDR